MIRFEFKLNELPEKLEDAAESIERLPDDPGQNPLALGLMDYQRELALTERPTISSTGSYGGASWPGFPEGYVQHETLGGPVPVWGGFAQRGRKKVKARIKSSGVGRGGGSRYKASDKQLGDRAGGLWSDWIFQKPVLGAFVAVLTSPFVYAARQFSRRPWWTPHWEGFTEDRLEARADEYLNQTLEDNGL